MFKYLISINPLGFMYGSSGAFLSPENLVGRSGTKFPPEAAALSGLILGKSKERGDGQKQQKQLRENLKVAGPFWAKIGEEQNFYVPIPWHKIISKKGVGEWYIKDNQWSKKDSDDKLEPDYKWQTISSWKFPAKAFKDSKTAVAANPWKFVSFLHPKIQKGQRCVEKEDGLFLENSVQIPDDICLIYLSTETVEKGWYRFGGENHIVEIDCKPINDKVIQLLNQPIERQFALIVPGVWGSTRFSYRYPQHENFPKPKLILTDKPITYRYRAKQQLGRGRYAVPAGTVCILDKPLGKPWWEWDEKWFPNEGISLKNMGCGLCLPVEIKE